jgi:hypothetical protein
MSVLNDIRTAAIAAVTTQVTSTVSAVTPDVPATVNPGEEFTFSVTAANTGVDAIGLVNVHGNFVAGMFLFPANDKLTVGDSDTISNLKGKGLALGNANINFHIHADPDLDFLFPKGNAGSTGFRNVVVT